MSEVLHFPFFHFHLIMFVREQRAVEFIYCGGGLQIVRVVVLLLPEAHQFSKQVPTVLKCKSVGPLRLEVWKYERF